MRIEAIVAVPKGEMCKTKQGVLCGYYYQRTCNLFIKDIPRDMPFKKLKECAMSKEVKHGR